MKPSGKHRYQILVVEDDPGLSKAIKLMLEFDGHVVQAVESSEAALATLEKSKFDLILTDYWLPGMKGNELAAIVKQAHPQQPIIMASGSFTDGVTAGNPVPGVDCLLNKPFSLTELREAMIWVLDLYGDHQPPRTHGTHWPHDSQRAKPGAPDPRSGH